MVHLTTGRRSAPNWTPTQPSVADLGSKSRRCRRQTTTKPILPSFLPTSVSVPETFLLNPTPLNLHNCLPGAASFKRLYRMRPPHLPSPHTYLWGASDTALTFLGSDRIHVAKAPICATPVPKCERPKNPQRSLRSPSRPWPPAKFALIFRSDTFTRKILSLSVDNTIYQW